MATEHFHLRYSQKLLQKMLIALISKVEYVNNSLRTLVTSSLPYYIYVLSDFIDM